MRGRWKIQYIYRGGHYLRIFTIPRTRLSHSTFKHRSLLPNLAMPSTLHPNPHLPLKRAFTSKIPSPLSKDDELTQEMPRSHIDFPVFGDEESPTEPNTPSECSIPDTQAPESQLSAQPEQDEKLDEDDVNPERSLDSEEPGEIGEEEQNSDKVKAAMVQQLFDMEENDKGSEDSMIPAPMDGDVEFDSDDETAVEFADDDSELDLGGELPDNRAPLVDAVAGPPKTPPKTATRNKPAPPKRDETELSPGIEDSQPSAQG